MGACISLGRAAAAPYRRLRDRRKRRAAKAPAAASAEAAATTAAASTPAGHSSADAAVVNLGFGSGFAARYALGRELGRGQFARVYAARALNSDAHDSGGDNAPTAVAVKVVPKELLRAPGAADDIRREARARARVRWRLCVARALT
jgi:serine/threonine protein kinase